MPKTITPTIQEFNMETGETITREMTAEELTQWEANQAIAAEYEAKKAADAEAKAALLARLGLTEDEAKLLLS